MIDYELIAKNLRSLKEKYGYSYYDLEKLTGLRNCTIANHMSDGKLAGKVRPSLDSLDLYATVFNCSVGFIITGSNDVIGQETDITKIYPYNVLLHVIRDHNFYDNKKSASWYKREVEKCCMADFRKAFNELIKESYREVIKKRYLEGKTQTQVGKEVGVTKARIGQIEHKVFDKLADDKVYQTFVRE